jgi:hypothetical protein
MKLQKTHLFVFIVVFILGLIFLTVYRVLRPEYDTPRYNFAPFPTIEPTNIPDADIGKIGKCTDTIQKCDPGIGCGMCGDDFECTPVGEDEHVIINGKKVGKGNWCLPGGKRELGCGTYTGRAIWSERAEGGTLKQKWSCVCLYPDLFGGNDCLTPLACKDNNVSGTDQTNNVLVDKNGNIWDPTDPDFNPKGRTPYDKDSDGNPLYQCYCNAGKDLPAGVKFVRMPNDPYRCHAEPCTPEHKLSMWNEDMKQCDCTSGGKTPNQFVHSNVTGQCLNSLCGDGGLWNDEKQICQCNDKYELETCPSKTMTRDSYTLDECPMENNPGGSFCHPSCQLPGGQPFCVLGKCSVVKGKSTCTCDNRYDVLYYGDRCQHSCIPGGGHIAVPDDSCNHGHSPYCCNNGPCDLKPTGEDLLWVCT